MTNVVTSNPLVAVKPSLLTITEGSIQLVSEPTFFMIKVGATRGFYGTQMSASVGLTFVYQGIVAVPIPLGNGTVRQQIGLKLRAANTCNVVYVMWWIDPTPGIRVSVKSNPGENTDGECGDNGYINLVPTLSNPVPTVLIGGTHTLSASINGNIITVIADGIIAWVGVLPLIAFTFDGPVGFRSDNANLFLEFLAP